MRKLPGRIASWAVRRYVNSRGGPSSLLTVIPSRVLYPLHREGLDPVPKLTDGPPIRRLRLPLSSAVWLVTGNAEVKQVLGAIDGYSTDFAHYVEKLNLPPQANPGGLGFTDPPAHTRLRRLLTPEFTMHRLARLRPRIDEIVNGCLDAMAAADGPVDLVEMFALPIPSLVICELLGVPYDDREEFQRRAMQRFDVLGGGASSLGALSESVDYLLGVIQQQREKPGDGLLGAIITEHGDEIDDLELAGLADGVLTGGFETTASMLALGALVLLQNPEAFAAVRDDDDAVVPLVEELLRYLSVVQVAFARFAQHDVTVGDVVIRKGDVVLCSLSAANRDPRVLSEPNRFDHTRRPGPHLAFGHGMHRCVGAELARMELRSAYPALVRRFPHMRLHTPREQLPFRKASIVYGLEELLVDLGTPVPAAG